MDKINITIAQEEINRHLSVPITDQISYHITPKEMPILNWYQVCSLGFGTEKDKGEVNAESESKMLDYAASLFSMCGQPFSILCEKKEQKITYAIGCEDGELARRLLKSAFGTVKTEKYIPQYSGSNGMYAHHFEAVRKNAEEADKRESVSSIHMSVWADSVAKILTQYPGMVRIDFHPVDSKDCDQIISNMRTLCDGITAYMETNIQAGESVSEESKDSIQENLPKIVKSYMQDNHSFNASVSWKGISSKLSDVKKETQYFIQLFTNAQKRGWTVEMTVSADLGIGELSSSEKKYRETALSIPLSAALAQAGYNCEWDSFGFSMKKNENRALLLPAAGATELISFPTVSFWGFERMKNSYYNLNIAHNDTDIPFAKLMQYDEEISASLCLPKKEMNRHTFICGMTGSGKTNTVHHLLSAIGDFPYLVIEPVKGEYHSLPGVKTYTMTAGSSKALCLNPFWFPSGSSLQYHIDYLKQIISSAFDLYAAMPNILEQSLILAYQHSGWDFIQNKNRFASELPESMLYPTFSDLCQEVAAYIDNADFGDELKGNYRGALLSRLQSFTSGPKGMLLNTSCHLPCDELNEKKVVISLDSLADDADKSIVMGVIIAQYYEYLKMKCTGSTKKELQHLVVMEEAHHLFAGDTAPSPSSEGGSGQSSSQKLVKTLNNMLAEIRAYGEGFIIVDQSPSALHPSVVKNTGVKIAHRIDYGEDIEAMQTALLLDKEDRELATLRPGQALVHFGGMRTSAKVQVPACATKEESVILENEEISGNSVVSTLLEDDKLSEYMDSVVIVRVIDHLLYDELDNCQQIYTLLCSAVKAAMIRYGHSELANYITREHILADYITALLPRRMEKLFPYQYCMCKMFYMFAERFLAIAAETGGQLSPAELKAFQNYRTFRINPRLLEFYQYTGDELCKKAHAAMGNRADLGLICNLTSDILKCNVTTENLQNAINRLLLEHYFLCMPKQVELLTAHIIALLSSQCRKDAL